MINTPHTQTSRVGTLDTYDFTNFVRTYETYVFGFVIQFYESNQIKLRFFFNGRARFFGHYKLFLFGFKIFSKQIKTVLSYKICTSIFEFIIQSTVAKLLHKLKRSLSSKHLSQKFKCMWNFLFL